MKKDLNFGLPEETKMKLDLDLKSDELFTQVINQFYISILNALKNGEIDNANELICLLEKFSIPQNDVKYDIVMDVLNKTQKGF